MYKKKMMVILGGILSLFIGFSILMISPDPMKENLELARQAGSPQEAAAAISENNKKDMIPSTIAYLLVGLGFAVTASGVFMSNDQKKSF